MYNNHKSILFIIGLLIFGTTYFLAEINISESMIQNFITFLSITFGFYMTSLSVLYNSKYIKKLYDEIDSKKPTQRKIHTLKSYFKNSAYWTLFSIAFIMTCSLFSSINQNNILDLYTFFEALIIMIISLNFIFMFLLFRIFLDGLIYEAMPNKEKS